MTDWVAPNGVPYSTDSIALKISQAAQDAAARIIAGHEDEDTPITF